MGTVPARHEQSAEQQQLYARAIKRVVWSARAIAAAGEDLRSSAPALAGIANWLQVTSEGLTGVEQVLRGD